MYRKFFKRGFDLCCSAVALVALGPLLLVTALLIRVESKGAALYKQTRVGRDGCPFQIIKFRTMLRLEDSYSRDGAQLENYARVTSIGRVLRKTSMDEIPQLINVLRGEMSVVGPRPTLPYQVERYTPTQKQRLDARPGITGLAQVSGRNKLTWEEKISFDLEYVENLTLDVDLRIILRTVGVLARGNDTHFVHHDILSEHKGDFRDDLTE